MTSRATGARVAPTCPVCHSAPIVLDGLCRLCFADWRSAQSATRQLDIFECIEEAEGDET